MTSTLASLRAWLSSGGGEASVTKVSIALSGAIWAKALEPSFEASATTMVRRAEVIIRASIDASSSTVVERPSVAVTPLTPRTAVSTLMLPELNPTLPTVDRRRSIQANAVSAK